MTGQRMRIDVIIPTYQPDGRLHRLLARLCAQTRPPEKIILMNTEERYYRLEQYADIPNLEVHHVTKREFDHGGTRRQAMAYASGDIAVFMTQDAVPKNQYLLERLTAPIEAGLAQAAYARQLPAPGCRDLEAFTREFNYPAKSRVKSQEDVEELGVKAYFCSNVCAAYLRAAYQEAGGSTAYDALLEGEADSQGLALALLLLCQRAQPSAPCVVVDGQQNGTPHLWNVVQTQEGYRHVDLTQGGAVFRTDQEMLDAGYTWDRERVPECSGETEE